MDSGIRGIVMTVLGVFFLITCLGVIFGNIFANYGVQQTDTYNLQNYANKSSALNFVSGLRSGLAQNPLITIFTAPLNVILYFFNLINIVSEWFSLTFAALGLPAFISDYAIMYVTAIIALGTYYIFFGRSI